MKNYKVYLLPLMLLTLGSRCSQTAGEYFNRPYIEECITAFEPGFMFCNGVKTQIPPKMRIPKTPEMGERIRDYYLDKEEKLFFCVRFGDCPIQGE